MLTQHPNDDDDDDGNDEIQTQQYSLFLMMSITNLINH